ncbi:hypothetical protein [uncultured Roseobacter sp.]|uniref:DUF6902 family protein n=1 Tax=uncultured Roseobacter sp. TaxID=114847 RepID=UPI002606C7D9|nr:hypothetical protein [uncultured Roseobacter sp.]
MSNVISIGLPRRPNLSQRQALLLRNFALHRRDSSDVFWLKENAELLNVLATSGARLQPEALEVYRPFYDSIAGRLAFFPQYYRFLLSVCLDLEDLGMQGDAGAGVCHRVRARGLVDAELSDLQRAEAERLLARRGEGSGDTALAARLRRFISCSDTFALPNKKAAYELTHIVFYLSEYGRNDPCLTEEAVTSLEFAGVLAWLDQDFDLLSEVCVALRFAGRTPSDIWEDWLALETGRFSLRSAAQGSGAPDAYHEYLVGSWWAAHAGAEGFHGTPVEGALTVERLGSSRGPLRRISEYMFHLGPARSCDWDQMRGLLEAVLGEDDHRILSCAAESTTRFGDFFEGFARADA